RRVAEKSGIEASEIEANAGLSSGTAASTPAAKAKPASSSPVGELDLGDRPARVNAPSDGKTFTPTEPAAGQLAAEPSKKFDRSKHEGAGTLDGLKAWGARAQDLARVAISTRTTSLDPMTAELCGISLAVGDNVACYVPLGHRDGGKAGGSDLFAP